MVVEGHCNCGSIRVNLPSLPSQSVVCYCDNCQRSSAGLCSTNYMVEKTDVDIKDPHGYLKNYKDGNTKSGSVITRQFCGNCGCPVITRFADESSPKIIVKAGLFDQVSAPAMEVFKENKPEWFGGFTSS